MRRRLSQRPAGDLPAMTRKLPFLGARPRWRSSSLGAGAQAGQAPASFAGMAPQGPTSDRDYELMESSGVRSVRLPMYWAGIQSETPFAAEPDFDGFDHDVRTRRRTRHPHHALRLGLAGMGRGAQHRTSRSRPPGNAGAGPPSCATPSTATAPTARSGSNTRPCPTCRSAPGRSGTRRTSSPSRARPSPARYAKLLRASGRVLHEADPGAKVLIGGLFGRPLQVPPEHRLRRLPLPPLPGRQREALLRRRRAAPLRRRRRRDAGPDPQPAADHERPPRCPHAALPDRDRLGIRQLRVALGARAWRARPGS